MKFKVKFKVKSGLDMNKFINNRPKRDRSHPSECICLNMF